jgi:Lrp/AsnC family leucine-responsive transcriptional regulator
MSNLGSKDLKILHELDRDSRQSNSAIGRKIRLSKEVVKYRIDRMLREGPIVRFYTLTNYFKLGIVKHKLYLRLAGVGREKLEDIGNYFKGHDKTEWVVTCTGRWDMIVGFLVRNINEFDEEVQKMMNRFGEHVQEKAMTTTLYLAHHLREFLADSPAGDKRKVVYHTSADEPGHVDGIDLKIIRMLTNNGRMPVTELASRLKTTAKVAKYRMRRMEHENIILGYKVHLDPRSMGKVFCKALVYLRPTTMERLNEFVSYCSSLPDAVWPQRVMGAWDFEIDFEIESYDRFQEVMFGLKEKFSDIVQLHEFVMISKEFKLDFFPGCCPQFS